MNITSHTLEFIAKRPCGDFWGRTDRLRLCNMDTVRILNLPVNTVAFTLELTTDNAHNHCAYIVTPPLNRRLPIICNYLRLNLYTRALKFVTSKFPRNKQIYLRVISYTVPEH